MKKLLASMVCILLMGLTACGEGTKTEGNDNVVFTQSQSGESKTVESSQSEEREIDTTTQPSVSGATDNTAHTEMMKTYAKVLDDLYTNQSLPGSDESIPVELSMGTIEDNHFAIADVNGDGIEELIIQYSTASMAGMFERIYIYVESSNSVWEEFCEFPLLHYYDNYVITADLSHNQGLAGDFWPYTLYVYNNDHENFESVATVDAWDKNFLAEDYNGKAFPADADKDGDGIVYYILTDGSYEYDNPIDGDAYKEWLDGYIGTAKEVKLNYQPLTQENIEALTK